MRLSDPPQDLRLIGLDVVLHHRLVDEDARREERARCDRVKFNMLALQCLGYLLLGLEMVRLLLSSD